MTIKVLLKNPLCLPVILSQGDWIDLLLAETVTLKAPEAQKMHIRGKAKDTTGIRTREVTFDSCIASLGVCIQLPAGYEAIVVPRSSTFKKYGIIQSNNVGVIDNSYGGNEDIWRMPMIATRAVTIPAGTRIAQFRIQLSQKATFWQKIKWLFNSSINIKMVPSLSGKSRGGIGSTGN